MYVRVFTKETVGYTLKNRSSKWDEWRLFYPFYGHLLGNGLTAEFRNSTFRPTATLLTERPRFRF